MKSYICLLEDNPDHAWLAMYTMQKNSSDDNISHFNNGQDFFDFMNTRLNELPKVIFIDMHMPGMDGIQVLRRLKRDQRHANIPVIMLTLSMHEKDITESYALGASGYIVKPLNDIKYKEALTNLNLSITVPRETK